MLFGVGHAIQDSSGMHSSRIVLVSKAFAEREREAPKL